VKAMKNAIKSVLVSMFVIIAAPAYSETGMQAIQIFQCEFADDATADQVLEVTSAWLKAAKKSTGGKNIGVGIRFPIAEGSDADGDFRFVITAPSFAEWGEFTDAYEGSEVAAVDQRLYELADCGNSTMWEGMMIK
jgi:hypothetical protein